jgi:hypothetical protein
VSRLAQSATESLGWMKHLYCSQASWLSRMHTNLSLTAHTSDDDTSADDSNACFIVTSSFFFFFLWYWGLNSGPHECKANTKPLSYIPSHSVFNFVNLFFTFLFLFFGGTGI